MKKQDYIRLKKRSRAIAPLLFFVLCSALFPETQVSISVSDNTVSIADQIRVKIIVKTNTPIQEITISTGDKKFEIIRDFPTEKSQEKEYSVFQKNILVSFFETGNFDIGPFNVGLIKDGKPMESLKTNSVPITVKSVLTKDDKDIKNLKNPIDFGGDPFFVLKYVLIALILISLFLVYLWWRKSKKNAVTAPKQPPLSPLEELETHIRELWEKKWIEKGKLKPHFIEFTKVLKHFLFRHYQFNAEDFTTYETLYFLKQCEKETSIADSLRSVLDFSDLVKFAQYVPDPVALQGVWDKTFELIDSYKRRVQEQTGNLSQQPKVN